MTKHSRTYWDRKIAKLEAQLVEATAARDAIASAISPTARPGNKTALAIAQYLESQRCRRPTLEEISQHVGVTRERVRQLIPAYGKESYRIKREQRRDRLARFIIEHPEAQLTPARGGMSMKAIAKATGLTCQEASTFWTELQLPDRHLLLLDEHERSQGLYRTNPRRHAEHVKRWRERNREKSREIQRRARRAYDARLKQSLLRRETCRACGVAFDWTRYAEKYQRHIVCSRVCGVRLSKRASA